MRVTQRTIKALTIAALLLVGGGLAQAEDELAKINSANQALVDGKLDEALAQYDAVAETMPDCPLLAYNRGVALYRQGQVDQARQAFVTAIDTDDPELAAKAGFNIGNCHYAAAVQQSETERAVAINSLKTAIAHYRSALQSNPADTDSRTNIELAQRLINKLQQEEQQEQQQQDQQDQNQDSQNQDSSQSEQDQSDQSNSQDQKSEEQNSDDSNSEKSESDETQSDEQSSKQEGAEDDSDESKSDESNSDQSEAAKQESDESNSGQQKDEEKPSEENSDGSNAEQSKQNPTEEQDSEGSENKDQNQQPEQEQSGQQPDQPHRGEQQDDQQTHQPGEEKQENESGQQMSAGNADQQDQPDNGQQTPGYGISQTGEPGENIDKEEAMKMLQAIRDRDLMRRMQKRNETRRRYRPVDRDW